MGHVKDRHKWGRSRHTLDYARRVVENVLNGPSMTDEAIQFVINRFWDYHSQNSHEYDDEEDVEEEDANGQQADGIEDRKHLAKLNQTHKRSRKLFEGCKSRTQCMAL